MTAGQFRDMAQRRIADRYVAEATANGTSSSRTIEELRYHAGLTAGLKAASVILDELLTSDEDDD